MPLSWIKEGIPAIDNKGITGISPSLDRDNIIEQWIFDIDNVAVVPTGLVTGAPTLGKPTAGVAATVNVTPTGLVTGAPTLGKPTLGVIHNLGAPTGLVTGAPTVGGGGIIYEETLASCTTADTQTGDIPGTDQGDACVANGSGNAYFRTVSGWGYGRLLDPDPVYIFFKYWDSGDLSGQDSKYNVLHFVVRTSSDFKDNYGTLRSEMWGTTGYAFEDWDFFYDVDGIGVKVDGVNHYKSGILTDSTTYDIKFVFNWTAETFSMYINDTLYSELTDLDFDADFVSQADLLAGYPRAYYLVASTSTRYIDFLGWWWETEQKGPSLGQIHVLGAPTGLVTGAPTLGGSISYLETLGSCTTANTQSGDIPSTDQGDATVASGGSSTAYVKTVTGGGYVRLIDETPSYVMFDMWQQGDLGITTAENVFIMKVRTGPSFLTGGGGGNQKWKMEQTSTGYALCEISMSGTYGGATVNIYNGSNHYKSSILANSTDYELRFVINYAAKTFSMYINGTLHSEYTDLAFWDAQNNAVLDSRMRTFDPGYGISEANGNYIDILEWGFYRFAALGQVHALTPTGLVTGTPTLGKPTVSSGSGTSVSPVGLVTGSPTLGKPTLSQIHALSTTGLVTGQPTLGRPTLGQTHVLGATGLVTGAPRLGRPTVTELGPLSPVGLVTGAPRLGRPTLGQIHALTTRGLVTGSPTLGRPNVSVDVLVQPRGLVTGSPTLGRPTLGQTHALTTTGLVTGQPRLGRPSLGQIHALQPRGLVTGSPTLGRPSISQAHSLGVTGLITGPPTLGRPTAWSLVPIYKTVYFSSVVEDGRDFNSPIDTSYSYESEMEQILSFRSELEPQVNEESEVQTGVADESEVEITMNRKSEVTKTLSFGSDVNL